jgi:hypothetical protein
MQFYLRLLTFTEARRDRTTVQCQCRLPCPAASPPLNACRCAAGSRVLSMPRTQCVRQSGSRESACVCPAAVCRIRPLQPEIASGMYARRTICKHVANNRRRSHPLKAMPRNRAVVGKMPALKGFRRCPSAHQMRQLTSYADGVDEPEHLSNVEWPRAVACARHENAHGVHVRNCAKDAFNVRFVASLHCPARPAYLLTST